MNVANWLLELTRPTKRIIALSVDIAICIFTVWLTFGIRLSQWGVLYGNQWITLISALNLSLPIFIVFGLYRAIFRYSGWEAFFTLTKAIGLYAIFYAFVFSVLTIQGIPRSVGVIQPLLMLFFIGASRMIVYLWLGGYRSLPIRLKKDLPKVLIYGAGSSGRQLAAAISQSKEMLVVGFIDDDENLHENTINGLNIFNPENIKKVIDKYNIVDILLAIPSANRERRNKILSFLRGYNVRVRTLPDLVKLASGKVHIDDIHELDIDDLLGRDPVAPNEILLNKNIRNKIVLVTGAGGSIGSELCRQIIRLIPKTLLLIEHNEYSLYSIDQELKTLSADIDVKIEIIPLLASIRDKKRINKIISTWQPNTIYHAAAYKHVPLVEHNPSEGIKNNIIGTKILAKAAIENEVNNFILISTDKAVRPTNIMGATKRVAELILQGLNAESLKKGQNTRFSMVRFGNVLGSSGSVVPLFRQQIHDGGPLTVTDKEVTRYFMTINEAAQLVIQAGAMAKGGDVFLLDMGEPIKIYDLALRMIELSGLTLKDEKQPDGDIEIKITGLRPGEKLYEELLIDCDPDKTQHPLIMKAHEEFIPYSELDESLEQLEDAINQQNYAKMRETLSQLVSGYNADNKDVDWIYSKNKLNR